MTTARLIGFQLGLLFVMAPATGMAEGERAPMVGGSVVAAAAQEDALGGVALDAVWWKWRVGLSAEGSMLWGAGESEQRATILGLSARFLVFDTLVESLVEPRNVELGVELQGIIERSWWTDASPNPDATRYGVGLALRLRGSTDYDLSNVLTESRVFVRVMTWPVAQPTALARSLEPSMRRGDSELMIVVGLGAAFGIGEPDYVERFRMEPFSPAAQRLLGGWF